MTYKIGDTVTAAHPFYGWYDAVITGITWHPDQTVDYYILGKHWVRPQQIKD